ncbi:MAG: hypothetical protein AOA65_1532 [Candidatus Bathyarchaeota archaeon BA1]|nr:MAG: hypothetical protein AOA65_1532 [Candidatus Bathyarchaeota archaeon BA1]
MVRVLVFPMVVLAIVRLWSHLARKMEYKIVLKSFAWIYASFILTADIMLLGGTVIPLRRVAAQPSPFTPGSPLHIVVTSLAMFSPPIVVPILFSSSLSGPGSESCTRLKVPLQPPTTSPALYPSPNNLSSIYRRTRGGIINLNIGLNARIMNFLDPHSCCLNAR